MDTSTTLGARGERIAAAHLQNNGYRIIDRNWRPRGQKLLGEIDIVARLGDTLAFVEVKTRRSTAMMRPSEAITYVKHARLRRLVGSWLTSNGGGGARSVRLDVIALVLPDSGGVTLRHIRGVAP